MKNDEIQMVMLKTFRHLKHGVAILSLFVIMTLAAGASADSLTPAFPSSRKQSTHLDLLKNPGSCFGCHQAHGKRMTPMMKDTAERLCFICHGPYNAGSELRSVDVFADFQKRSKHPVLETAHYHKANEVLPEKSPGTQRHVSCYDCHEPHSLKSDKKMGRLRGVTLMGLQKTAERDSEVCYKCHSDSANIRTGNGNVKEQFQPENQSYHPIERPAKTRSVSLARNIPRGATMECTDCHTPHGSDWPPLLKKNYSLADASESTYTYELCYSCHRRESILNNESFTGSNTKQYGHREHIILQRTSCHTCHAAHGSQWNSSIIQFDMAVVTGAGQFIPTQKGTASCILTCHGKKHEVTMTDPPILKKHRK